MKTERHSLNMNFVFESDSFQLMPDLMPDSEMLRRFVRIYSLVGVLGVHHDLKGRCEALVSCCCWGSLHTACSVLESIDFTLG